MQDTNIIPHNQIDKLIKFLTWAVAALVALIGAIALYISYEALYQTALDNGYSGLRAYVWPALIDAPLIVFTLAVLLAQLMRQRVIFWAFLVVVYTVATIAFNLAHAHQTALGWAVAVAAPVGLLLTTEALRHLAKVHIERFVTLFSLSELSHQLDGMTAQRDSLTTTIEQQEEKLSDILSQQTEAKQATNRANVKEMNAAKDAKIQERREQVFTLLNLEMSQKDIAEKLGVSSATIRRDVKALNGRVK